MKKINIGKTIKELRLEKGFTQSQLAKMLFVSQDTISLWELDKSVPDVNAVITLCQIFGVSADYLLGLEK